MKSIVLASVVASAGAAQWAVIMAGSNGYNWHYQDQANACHAYQIAKGNGIPESNIILLAYDDIAHAPQNPFPGKIFNKPTPAGVPGKDVYNGCKISYRGSDVTAENFLKVLSGDTSAPGPVLKSSSEDHVFVFYTGQGGTGVLGVPDCVEEDCHCYGEDECRRARLLRAGYIHASDINKAIETLQSKGGYKEMLLYVDAPHSGSIFSNLLKAPNAKAVTSSKPTETSFNKYCPQRICTWKCWNPWNKGCCYYAGQVDGKNIGACLASEFSRSWMEDADARRLFLPWNRETVGRQVKRVKAAVVGHSILFNDRSHPQEYGVHSFDSEPVGNFEGFHPGNKLSFMAPVASIEGDAVDSRQVEVHQAYQQTMRAETAEKRKDAEQELETVLARRHATDVMFAAIASAACETGKCSSKEVLEGHIETWNMACHKAALELVVEHCGPFTDYSLRHSRLFANLCKMGMDQQTVQRAIQKGCGNAVVV